MPIHPDSQPYLRIAIRGKVYLFKTLFWAFYSSPGLHQSVCCDFRMGSQAGYTTALSELLASDRGVSSFLSSALSDSSSLVKMWGWSSLWRSRTLNLPAWFSIWGAEKHHPREGLPDGLSDCQVSRFGRQVPSPPGSCEDVAAFAWPCGFPGTVHSQGLSLYVPSSVVAKDSLVCSFGQSCKAGPSF